MTRSPALLLSALLALPFQPGCGRPRPEPPPTSLVLITLDTVRRDHLPTYGYGRDTAPGLDAFSRDAVVFDGAISQETNTTPSHASMFTGVYPHTHGSRDNGQPVPPGRPTLAEVLSAAGFSTAAFVSATPLKAGASGLDRGFAQYEDRFEEAVRPGGQTAALAARWLDARRPDERFFLFVHLYEAHGPYLPPPAYRRFRSEDRGPVLTGIPAYQVLAGPDGRPLDRLNDYVDLYDGEIRYLDDLVGTILKRVDPAQTVICVLSDHGETLGGRHHVLDHGGSVFDEEIRIPLILRAPGVAPRRVPDPVQTIDLAPTLLDLLGVPPPARGFEGRNLARLLRGGDAPGKEPTFSSARASSVRHADRGYRLDPARRLEAVRTGRYKLIVYPGSSQEWTELYDLQADPGETRNLADAQPDLGQDLRETLRSWSREGTAPGAAPVDPRTLEQLRSLGYVGN